MVDQPNDRVEEQAQATPVARRPRLPAAITWLALGLVSVGGTQAIWAETSTALWVLALLGLAASIAAIVLEYLRHCTLGLALAIAEVLAGSLLIMAAAFFKALRAFFDSGVLWFH